MTQLCGAETAGAVQGAAWEKLVSAAGGEDKARCAGFLLQGPVPWVMGTGPYAAAHIAM